MEDTYLVSLMSALWFGVLTSISPCPLATNIAAISFIGRNASNKAGILWAGMSYTLGRMIAYLAVSAIVLASLISVPDLARFLQKYMNISLGPVLIIIGLFLLELIKLNFGKGSNISERLQDKAKRYRIVGPAMLGFVFALSFCPVSAGLFFSSLLPIIYKYQGTMAMPLIYGLGTALPVIVFAFVIGFAMHLLGSFYRKMATFEYWARRVTGVLFILAGLYMTWEYIL